MFVGGTGIRQMFPRFARDVHFQSSAVTRIQRSRVLWAAEFAELQRESLASYLRSSSIATLANRSASIPPVIRSQPQCGTSRIARVRRSAERGKWER